MGDLKRSVAPASAGSQVPGFHGSPRFPTRVPQAFRADLSEGFVAGEAKEVPST